MHTYAYAHARPSVGVVAYARIHVDERKTHDLNRRAYGSLADRLTIVRSIVAIM